MTNKTKTILCVCALTASAFAWNATAEGENYGVYEDHTTGAWFLNLEPGGFDANNNAIGYLKKSTFTSLYDNSVLSLTIERNDTQHGFSFGTYTYDLETHEITSTTLLGTVDGNKSTTVNAASGVESTGSTAFSEAFKANEVVGLWVQENKANAPIYYSQNELTERENDSTLLAHDPNNPDTKHQYTEAYVYGPTNDKDFGRMSLWFDDAIPDSIAPNYDFGYPGQETKSFIKIHVTGAAPEFASHPTGGPLPGVWATIALAGAASAYLKRRRKENK